MASWALAAAKRLDWLFSNLITNFFNNPIIYSELIRSLRRGRYFILMAILLAVGTLILCLLWSIPHYDHIPTGRILFFAVAGGQAVVIILLLPGYVAQSIITERDRDTLPLLLTTPLGAGRILFGKMVSTLGVVLLLLISTYPLASVCMARGGVSPMEASLFAAGLLTAAFISSAFAVYHALYARTVLRAILMTQFSLFLVYMLGAAIWMFLIGVVMSVLAIIAQLAQWSPQQSWVYYFVGSALLVGLPIALGLPVALLIFAAQRLRYLEPNVRPIWGTRPEISFQLGQTVDANTAIVSRARWIGEWRLEDGDNPFYRRERKSQAAVISIWAIPSWYLIAIIAYHLLLITPIQEGRWLVILSLLFIAQMTPAHAAPLFAGERENETWDLLLTTLTRARSLLNGKLMAVLQPCLTRWAALTFTPVIIIFAANAMLVFVASVQIPTIPLYMLIIYTLIMLTQLLFLTLLGAWLSIRAERTGRVLTWHYGIIGILYFAPIVLYEAAALWLSHEIGLTFRALSPLLMAYDAYDKQVGYVMALTVHFVFYWTLCGCLYFMALRRLERGFP